MNKTSWYTVLIFLGFLIALVALFSLSSMFSPKKQSKKPTSQAVASTKPTEASASAKKQEANEMTKEAIEEVKKLTHAQDSDVKILKQEYTDWPDTSLGCPTPGFAYAQVIVPGYNIVLQVDGEQFEYHTDLNKDVKLCKSKQVETP